MSTLDRLQNNHPRLVPFLLLLVAVCAFPTKRLAAGAAEDLPPDPDTQWQTVDDFEGVQTSWHIPPRESLRCVLAQRRTDQSSRQGLRCEHIAVLAAKGDESIYATHPLPPSMAIREFQASLWLRGNRPGFQLMARVRLPRTLDEETGQPMSLLVEGDTYAAVGNWQRLSLGHVDQALADKTRALRAERGRRVDRAEAYVDLIVLNLYGGAGLNRLWVDDLRITGAVPCPRLDSNVPQVSFHASPDAPQVGMRRDVLLVQDVPFLPRIHVFQGESFDLLRKLGFNCVWLPRPASDPQNALARRHELWLICPAPEPPLELEELDRVLAWCVGANVTSREAADLEKRARHVRSRDALSRPLVLSTSEHRDDWSRYADIVVLTGSGAEDARPSGRPRWRAISLEGPTHPPSWLWVRDQLHRSIALGHKGLVLASQVDLEQPVAVKQRQLAELLNLECESLEPWGVAHRADASQEFSAGDPEMVTVLRKSHSQLALVRLAPPPGDELVTPRHTSVTVPTAGAHAAFLMETDRVSPLALRHIAGGVEIALPAGRTSAKIVFTDQATVIRRLTQHLQKTAPRVKALLLDVARAEILELDGRIARLGPAGGDQLALRRQMHRLHGLLPPQDRNGEHEITGRQLEPLFAELERIRKALPTSSAVSRPPNHPAQRPGPL